MNDGIEGLQVDGVIENLAQRVRLLEGGPTVKEDKDIPKRLRRILPEHLFQIKDRNRQYTAILAGTPFYDELPKEIRDKHENCKKFFNNNKLYSAVCTRNSNHHKHLLDMLRCVVHASRRIEASSQESEDKRQNVQLPTDLATIKTATDYIQYLQAYDLRVPAFKVEKILLDLITMLLQGLRICVQDQQRAVAKEMGTARAQAFYRMDDLDVDSTAIIQNYHTKAYRIMGFQDTAVKDARQKSGNQGRGRGRGQNYQRRNNYRGRGGGGRGGRGRGRGYQNNSKRRGGYQDGQKNANPQGAD